MGWAPPSPHSGVALGTLGGSEWENMLPCRGKSLMGWGGGQELHSCTTVTTPSTPPKPAETCRVRRPAAGGWPRWGGPDGDRWVSALSLLPRPHPPALWTRWHPEHCRKMWLQRKPPQNPGRGQGERAGVTHRAGGAAAAAAALRSPSAAAASWLVHNPPGPGAAAERRGAGGGGTRAGAQAAELQAGAPAGRGARLAAAGRVPGLARSGRGHPGGAAGRVKSRAAST